MVIEGPLGDWLADAKLQWTTVASMERAARIYRERPEMAALAGALGNAAAAGPDAVLAVASHFLTTPGASLDALEPLIEAARQDPFYRPHLRLSASKVHSGLMLLDGPAASLVLGVLQADAIAAKRAARSGGASIIFTGVRSVYRFVRTGGAILSFWEAPPIREGFSAHGGGVCRLVDRRRINDGELLELDGSYQTFVVEAASGDLVYLLATPAAGAAPLTVEYDSETRRFVGACSTDEASSRTQMMLALLRTMARRDAVPLFEGLLTHGHFYARWQAMRELLALDAEAALPHLEKMAAADPHPDVRAAAAQTLECFFPEYEIEEERRQCRG